MTPHRHITTSNQLEQGVLPLGGDGVLSYSSFQAAPERTRQHRKLSCSQKGARLGKICCDWSGCAETFTREHDLRRHRDTVHQPRKQFWCIISGCNRSEGFLGEKRPFSRKDKLNSHVRTVHATLSSSVSGFTAAIPNVGENVVDSVMDTNGIAGINESANDSGLAAVYGLSGEPSWFHDNLGSTAFRDIDTPVVTGMTASVDGFTDVNGFTTVNREAAFPGFTETAASTTTADALTDTNYFPFTDGFVNMGESSASGFTGANGYAGADGFTTADGFIEMNELTSTDGLIDIDTPVVTGKITSADGFIGIDEFTTIDGQVAFPGFTGIAASTTTADALAGTNYFSFTDEFADTSESSTSCFTGANGHTGIDGFTGANGFIGIDELTSTDGLTDTDWPVFTDASVAIQRNTPNCETEGIPPSHSLNNETWRLM